jgi:hypothetical protein
MSLPELFEKEKVIYEKLDEFNKYYACYVRQEYNDKKSGAEKLPESKYEFLKCSGSYTEGGLKTIYGELETLLDGFVILIPDSSSTNEYTTQYLLDTKADVDRRRADIQTKLNEINESTGSHALQSKLELDGTVYASLIWTTMATCVIYYTMVIM